MKLDNKGWGLAELLIYICIILFALILVVVLINGRLKKFVTGNSVTDPEVSDEIEDESKDEVIDQEDKIETNNVYEKLEEDVLLAAQKYLTENTNYNNNIITVNTLKGEGLLKEFKDPNNEEIECSGYAKIKKEEEKNTFDVYLKCGSNYETIGYDKKLDYAVADLTE